MWAVIMAGGNGTRLWPLSREHYPKHLLSLVNGQKSLFQETVIRVRHTVPTNRIIVVTHHNQKDALVRQLGELGVEDVVLLQEPLARNTAPAIGLAAWYLYREAGPAAIMATLPSDHFIAPAEAFAALLDRARTAAGIHGLITIGIKPTCPETGYGYIRCGRQLDADLFQVEKFTEKPAAVLAQAYIQDPRFLWHSGICVFRIGDLMAAYRRCLPDLYAALEEIDYRNFRNLEEKYRLLDSISIDCGILEKMDGMAVIRADLTWSDVGSWAALHQISPRDEHGNCLHGRTICLDTRNSLVYSPASLVGTIGVDNLVIVNTGDAVLVCTRDRSQEVKSLVDLLKTNNSQFGPVRTHGPDTEPNSTTRKAKTTGKDGVSPPGTDHGYNHGQGPCLPEDQTDIYQRLHEWLEAPDLDSQTRQELLELQSDPVSVRDRFGKELAFGTGGLRGKIGAGLNRMNVYVVRKATQGLANLLNSRKRNVSTPAVAISCDTRLHSREFAEEAALVLAANGIKSFVFDGPRPTPLLSFAVRELGCDAGVAITASHNPPEDNGYKVYGPDGGQAVSPFVDDLARTIASVRLFHDVRTLPRTTAESRGLLKVIPSDLDRRYQKQVLSLSLSRPRRKIRVVFTPLHGTGSCFIPALLRETGYLDLFLVPEQMTCDPAFSTVRLPNPEEKESFTLALKLAETTKADLVMAADPDGDRLGAAVRDELGKYHFLSGNQIGALLLDYLLNRLQEQGRLPARGLFLKTIVTGDLGGKIAAAYGVSVRETLTGFKYIGEQIRLLEEAEGSPVFLFGYEESCGYLAGTFVRDKDANIAALLLAEMAAFNHEQGANLLQVLDSLQQRYGYYQEDLVSLDLSASLLEEKIMAVLEQEPPLIPEMQLVEKRDYHRRQSWNLVTGERQPLSLPQARVLYYRFADGSWFCVRPSGTEPKIKFYFAAVASSSREAKQKLTNLKNAVLATVLVKALSSSRSGGCSPGI